MKKVFLVLALVAAYGVSMAMISTEVNTVNVDQTTIVADTDDLKKEEPKKAEVKAKDAKASAGDGCATAKSESTAAAKGDGCATAKSDGCATAKKEGCSSKKSASAEKVAENK